MKKSNYFPFPSKRFLSRGQTSVKWVLLLTTFLFSLNQLKAQVAAYSFAQSIGGYAEITGGIVLGTPSNDDQRFVDPANLAGGTISTGPGFDIGFTFTYNNLDFNRVGINSNGWICLGQSALTPSVDQNTSSAYTPLSSTVANTPAYLRSRIAGMGRDLQGNGTTSELRIQTIGTAPNRVFVAQWKDYKRFSTTGTGDILNFQIRLYEGSNVIEVVYGAITFGTTLSTATHVGLGGTTSTDFNNRTTTTDWNATTAGGTNAAGCSIGSTVIVPANGRTFTWAPPPPAPIDLGATALVSPPATGCYSNAQQVTVTIKNFGTTTLNFSTLNATVNVAVTGAVVQNLMTTLTSDTLAPNASMNVPVGILNMSTAGTYTFNANTVINGDGNAFNDAMAAVTRTVPPSATPPLMVDFTGFTGANLTTVFPGWSEAAGVVPAGTTSLWTSSTLIPGSGTTARINLFVATRNEWILSPVFTPGEFDSLKFKVAITDFASGAADPSGMQGTDDKVRVQISTDCGSTWSTLYTFEAATTVGITNVLVPFSFSLNAFAGMPIRVGFYATDGPIDDLPDYDFHIDDINITALFPWYADADGDGYGNANALLVAETQPAGYVANKTDCDDGNPNVNPAATEVCNGIDDDCDGDIDEGVKLTFYADADGDGFGNPNVSTLACSAPAGFVANNTDCNDGNPNVNPAATEVCNDIDDDCDGEIDEGVKLTFYQDNDGDGFGNPLVSILACTAPPGYVLNNLDCNDNAATIYPGAPELCNNIDDNCNGEVDEGVVPPTWYLDADGDGYGNPAVSAQACTAPAGYVANNTDCNDGNANINPGMAELCNGIDDNCNGQIDEGVLLTFYFDTDGDGYGDDNISGIGCVVPPGYVLLGGDCDENNPAINPGATEICNDIDDDCDGGIDEVCNLCQVELPACKTVYKGYGPASQATLTASPSGGTAPYTYAWSNGANTQSITVSPNVNTTYTVTLTDYVGCTSTASTLVESVNIACGSGQAKVYICHSGSTQCVLVRLVAGHLAHGDALGPCDLNVCQPYQQNVSPPVINNSTIVFAGAPIGDNHSHEFGEHETALQQVSVFPNPALERVNVALSEEFGSAIIRIIDLQGRVVLTRELEVNGQQYAIPVGNFAKGTYLVQVIVDGESFTEKLIIE